MTAVTAAHVVDELETRTYRIPTTADDERVPTYVLLHGIGLSHRFFSRLGRALAPSGNVVSFDLPGFGPTRRPDRQVTVEDHALIIRNHLDRHDTGPVVLVGHSMGAQFAIELARQDPTRISRVVLIGPVVDTAHRTLRAHTVRLVRDALLEPPRTQLVVLFDYIRCGIPWFAIQAAAMRDYPTRDRVADLVQPVLIIRGQHDPIAPAAWCVRLAESIRLSARPVTVARKRHNVAHSDPAGVASAITTWVSR